MDKRLILNKYSKPEEKLLISKMIDKIELTTNKNKIQNTDFLNIYQSHLLEKILKQEKVENYIINGGISDSERNIIVFFPEKLSEIVNTNTSKILPIKCIRIKLPKEMYGKYTHRDYLGGLIKLDCIVSEIAKTSRGKAEEIINDARVFVNYENIMKSTKQIKEKDIITIRRIGKFKLERIDGKTRNDRVKIIVSQYI